MICPRCGTETTAPFCPNCGGTVPAPRPGVQQQAQPQIPTVAPPGRIVTVLEPQAEKNWALGAHLSALAGMVIPFGNVIGPLVVWLTKKDESPLVDREGKEAVNFQISMSIYLCISAVLIIVLIGIPMLFVVGVLDLIFTIVAAVKTSNGERYRYPLSIRFIK